MKNLNGPDPSFSMFRCLREHRKTGCMIVIAGLLLSGAGLTIASAKFRGGSVKDVVREAKEAIETANQQSKLEAMEQLTDLREQIREPMEQIAYITAAVNTVTRGFDILQSDYKGLLSFDSDDRDAVKRKLDNLYRVEFEDEQFGNQFEMWKKHREKVYEAQEEQHKQSADVTANSMEFIDSIQEQRDAIMRDASAGVISEKQKKALLQSLDASILTASNQVRAQELAVSVSADIADKADRDLSEAASLANQIGSGATHTSDAYKEDVEENRITELPR